MILSLTHNAYVEAGTMHLRQSSIFLLVVAALTLSGCNQPFNGALNGVPNFPTAGILPVDAQQIVGNASTSATTPLMAVPAECQAVINYEDNISGGPPLPSANPAVQPAINPITDDKTYAKMRDNCIYLYIGAIDHQYGAYKSGLMRFVNGATWSADSLATIASGAGAALGGTTGQILAGIASGIGALKTTTNADLLYKNSITAIINQTGRSSWTSSSSRWVPTRARLTVQQGVAIRRATKLRQYPVSPTPRR
jgi:hypothetical protein